MSDWKTAAEWAAEGLAGLPSTKRNINALAKREGWQELGDDYARRNKSAGGGWEYYINCLPADARGDWERRNAALNASTQIAQQADTDAKAIVSNPTDLAARQRMIMESRAALLREVNRREISRGCSTRAAILSLVDDVKHDLACVRQEMNDQRILTRDLIECAVKANDKGCGRKAPSRTTIYAWMSAYKGGGVAALAPELTRDKQPMPEWLPGFLRHYAKPQGPSIAHALEKYAEKLPDPSTAPSYPQVRRALKALKGTGNHLMAHKGREGPLALKARLMFKRRTLEGMEPTIVYTADGKTFDAEIAHPIHGQPFRPEVTTIIDVVTRKIVGWSIDLAENSRAVTDALRRACIDSGVPAIFYADNGPGYKNASVLALCARLGTTTTHSIPYNSQARGMIERVNGTVWNKAAKEFVSYIGPDMDREAAQRVHKQTRRELKEFGTSRTLPDFEHFMQVMNATVEAYNNARHSSLEIRDPETGRKRKASPNEKWAEFANTGFDHFPLPAEDADDLFRPHIKRRCTRGHVVWLKNEYFDAAMEPYHGMDVLVGYDIHDATKVWVRELEMIEGQETPGRLICVADFYHNKERYFPVSFEQQAAEKRVAKQLNRLENKKERALADLRGSQFIEAPREEPMQVLDIAREREVVRSHRADNVVELAATTVTQPKRDLRNPSNDPDIKLAWDIVDAPAESPIPPHHISLMWDVLRNPAAVTMMRDVQLPLAELQNRLEVAAELQKSSTGGNVA